MESTRVKSLNERQKTSGDIVLYVMSRDQRVHDNHALLAAQQHALQLGAALVVFVNLSPKVGFRRKEHYQFMLDGLLDVQKELHRLHIGFVVQTGDALSNIGAFTKDHNVAATYFDFSPLHSPRQLQERYAQNAHEQCFVVDTHNIIPVWELSNKQEFAAHTIRPKVRNLLSTYLVEPEKLTKNHVVFSKSTPITDIKQQFEAILHKLEPANIQIQTQPGESAATEHLQTFIPQLSNYAVGRNDIAHDQQSGLSPYLHFGHISSLRVALEVMYATNADPQLLSEARMPHVQDIPTATDGMNALLEEMIVRKELADNFCFYAASYTSLQSMPDWAKKTLSEHANDKREFVYTVPEWEEATTHDASWNAAQMQLRKTGKIHGYMRMYWAKKILEWSESPEQALVTAIYLNNSYSIDGGDPNGYVGILWSIAGLHDRAWTRRPVYGTIRYMNEGGLRRKFDVDTYIAQWC